MKRLMLTCLLLVSLASCKEWPKKIDYIWTGKEGIRHFVPVCIVWYKQLPWTETVWKPYKAFSQRDAEQMREIILQLTKPEIKESNPNLKTEDKLSLIFYNGFPEKLTVREIYFEIKDQIFIGPLGKSNTLAKILLERQEVRPLFYHAYKKLGPTHYRDDFERILQINEYHQKLAEKRKAAREAKALGKNAEPNENN